MTFEYYRRFTRCLQYPISGGHNAHTTPNNHYFILYDFEYDVRNYCGVTGMSDHCNLPSWWVVAK